MQRRGFTLGEVIVTLGAVGVVIALLVPAAQKVREAARRTECANNLKQIGLAIHGYHDQQKHLPPSRLGAGNATWLVLLLLQLDQENTLKGWNLRKPYFDQAFSVQTASVKQYVCPSRGVRQAMSLSGNECDTRDGQMFPGARADYACSSGDRLGYGGALDDTTANGAIVQARWLGESGNGGWFSVTSLASLTDGSSNTILVGEKHIRQGWQGQCPSDAAAYNGSDPPSSYARCGGPGFPLASSPTWGTGDEAVFGGPHPTLCQFVMGDGRVQSLANSIRTEVLRTLVVRNDGEGVMYE